MKYRLLGPLEVVIDGEVVKLTSLRQRVVLSMLLMEANRVVPLNRLVDAVWDETPPATARSQIHTCISALRMLLGADGESNVIATRPAGYEIRVADGSLDISVFKELTARGRAAAADQRLAEAVQELRHALALWRGLAAAGVESRLVQAAAARLNEDYLSVLVERIELELRLGRHHDLVGELAELVMRHPLHEGLRARHMLALYRSARQAEALESFHAARRVFIEELGLEPGKELAALQRAILANDPALQLNPAGNSIYQVTDAGEGVPVPRQLPAAIADFTGREDTTEKMVRLLTAPLDGNGEAQRYLPIVTLTGKGGVGKTALALQVAHAIRAAYPDGQLFIQLREADGRPVSPLEALARFLRALGVSPVLIPQEMAERTAMYRSALGNRRVLVVLDDAQSLEQVSPLIPGAPGCAVLIASRCALPGLVGAEQVDLDDLDIETSLDLLAKVIGRERVESEPEAARTLVRLCGCIPLALRIAAAKLAERSYWTLDQMIRRMADDGRLLDELMLGAVGVRATLTLSYGSLSQDARRLFMLLGLMGASDFPAWVGAPLLDMAVADADDVMGKLVAARLVEVRTGEERSPRFRLHDLIRLFARERLAAEVPTRARVAALSRLAGAWLSLAAEAHRRASGGDFATLHGAGPRFPLPGPFLDQVLARPLSWFRAERAGLVSAIVQAGHVGLDELCWDLALTTVTLFESEYQVEDWRITHEIALEATRRAGNRRGEAATLYSLGNLAVTGRIGEAAGYLEPALAIFEELGDAHGCALAVAALAFLDRQAGRRARALARYDSALTGFTQVGDRVCEADTLTNMGMIQMDMGRGGVARNLLSRALAISQGISAPRTLAQTEHRFGEFHLRTGDLPNAERSFTKVLEIVRREGDLVGEAYALAGLGDVRTQRGKYEIAEADLAVAQSLSTHMSDSLVHGRVLIARAELSVAMGDLSEAATLLDEALQVPGGAGAQEMLRPRCAQLRSVIEAGAPGAVGSEGLRRG